MQNRVDVKKFIVQIEKDFSVNEWQVNDIYLWPIIRIKLFFYLINKIESEIKISSIQSRGSNQNISPIRKLL